MHHTEAPVFYILSSYLIIIIIIIIIIISLDIFMKENENENENDCPWTGTTLWSKKFVTFLQLQ